MSCAGMKLIVDSAHALLQHVRIDLGRGEIGVAEHHLNGSQVRSPLKQMGRKGVAQHVRTQGVSNPSLLRVGLQNLPESHSAQTGSAAARVDEEPRASPLDQHRYYSV